MRIAKILVLIGCLSLSGCWVADTAEFLERDKSPSYDEIYEGYDKVTLKESTAGDVLSTIHMPDYELLGQSTSVIASQGEKKEGYEIWFNMVSFNENEMTAQRKYVFIIDEKPKVLFKDPWTGVKFDCAMVFDRKILDEPYSNENARRIAILKQVHENISDDIEQVGLDNKQMRICGMLINQAMQTVINKLDSITGSPILATKLNGLAGLEFNHVSLNKGQIQMVIVDDVVRTKVRLGTFMEDFMGAEKYKCMKCEYIYDPFFGDPEGGIEPGVGFENLPADWVCPICGAGKREKMEVIDRGEKRKKKLNLFIKQLFGRERHRCFRCGYIYDPLTGDLKNGIERGTDFEDLPNTWSCPDCGAGKNEKM